MIEIMAIVRPNKTAATKKALIEIQHPSYTCIKAMGRGKKSVEVILNDGFKLQTKMVAKRVFLIIVEEAAKEVVIQAIMKANSSNNPGDGKIFVSKVQDVYQVRTGDGK